MLEKVKKQWEFFTTGSSKWPILVVKQLNRVTLLGGAEGCPGRRSRGELGGKFGTKCMSGQAFYYIRTKDGCGRSVIIFISNLVSSGIL